MTTLPYAYFDHDADIGIVGRGASVEAAFVAAAQAMFAIMADLPKVRGEVSVAIAFEESDLELALVTWLNRLLAEASSAGLIFGHFELMRRGSGKEPPGENHGAKTWSAAWR
jgi:SHS2 domain-containing protein